jgi:hypothetical protein
MQVIAALLQEQLPEGTVADLVGEIVLGALRADGIDASEFPGPPGAPVLELRVRRFWCSAPCE